MNWPVVEVFIPTYNRPAIVEHTVELLHTNLTYSGKYHIVISDDGDQRPGFDNSVQYREGPKAGLGANLNKMLRLSQSDYWFQLDDDHWLTAKLNLNEHVLRLKSDGTSGWIRLMGVGSHKYVATLDGDYWRIAWDSPETYIPSNRPHLKHRRFHESFGMYPDGLKVGKTEDKFCQNCTQLGRERGGPSVLIPLRFNTEESWQHVGDSWQQRGK